MHSVLRFKACICFFRSGKIHKLQGISQTERLAEEFKRVGWVGGRRQRRHWGGGARFPEKRLQIKRRKESEKLALNVGQEQPSWLLPCSF